jgi:predicted MFS family arabinose efflux permease
MQFYTASGFLFVSSAVQCLLGRGGAGVFAADEDLMSRPARTPEVLLPSRHGSRLPTLPAYRRNLWLLLGMVLVSFVGIGVQALVLNLYLVSIGFREDFLGLFSFVNTAGIGGAALLAGRASNKFGSRRTLLAAVGVLAGSSAALIVSQNPALLLVVALINGAALAHIFVPSATFVMDNADPDHRSTAYAGYFAAQSVAMVVGSYLGGAMPTALANGGDVTSAGYAWTILTSAGLAALGVVPMYLADDSRASGSSISSVRRLSRGDQRRQMRRDMAWIVGSNTLVAASMGFALPFVNVFFEKRLSADAVEIGLVFAIASAAMVVASIGGPYVGRRFGVVPTIVACRALTAPIVLGLGFAPSIGLAAVLYVFRTLVTNLTWPVDNAFTMELVSPDLRATLAALRSASWNFAWALTSGLAGLMIVELGFTSIFVASAVFMVGGCVAYYLAFRSRVAVDGPPSARVAAVSASNQLDAL